MLELKNVSKFYYNKGVIALMKKAKCIYRAKKQVIIQKNILKILEENILVIFFKHLI